RRRHTRFSRDWSSDVCSSDLITQAVDKIPPPDHIHLAYVKESRRVLNANRRNFAIGTAITLLIAALAVFSVWQAFRAETQRQARSEERRVGNAGGARSAPSGA